MVLNYGKKIFSKRCLPNNGRPKSYNSKAICDCSINIKTGDNMKLYVLSDGQNDIKRKKKFRVRVRMTKKEHFRKELIAMYFSTRSEAQKNEKQLKKLFHRMSKNGLLTFKYLQV